MPVNRCRVDGQTIRTLDDFYDEISRQLNFRRHFGRNLDALWDVLTADVPGPLEIIWDDADASKVLLGADFDKITCLLAELAEDRDDVTIIFR